MFVKEKQMHPIIKEYIQSDELLIKIVERFYDKTHYLENVLYEISIEINKKDFNPEVLISIDKAIVYGHEDINLYIIFIGASIGYCCLYNQIEKSHSLISIANTIPFEKLLPMVRAYYLSSISQLKTIEGKINEGLQLNKDAIALIDKSYPRYIIYLHQYSSALAFQGRLKEYGNYQLSSEEEHAKVQALRPLYSKIVNTMVTGNYKAGLIYIDEFHFQRKNTLPHRIEVFRSMLKIISGDFKVEEYQENYFKNLALVYYCLSLSRFEQARQYYLEFILENWPKNYIKTFIDYLPIHIELCLSEKGKAKWLLYEKINSGNIHYMDDFFLGRIQLLENDLDGADETFVRLMENINRYDAMGRLNFEIQFAKEISLNNVLKLLAGWLTPKKEVSNKSKPNNMKSAIVNAKGLDLIIGKSSSIHRVKQLIKKYASIKAPILITGETGTGKELVSRAIHDEGLFPNEPFLVINCGALSDSLLQSELFGHEAGAFTGAQNKRIGIFEAAGKGTVFLDEFGDISSTLQVSLLRVLESNEIRMLGSTVTKKIECKIVIATNVELHNAVVDKHFREDLFFRLSRFEIKIPALKDRIEDIPELIHHFLANISIENEKKKTISARLLQELLSYDWPGNIRELKNEIERMYILNPDQEILDIEHFDFKHLQNYKMLNDRPTKNIISVNHTVNKKESELNIVQTGFPIEYRQNRLKELFIKYKKLTRNQIMQLTEVSASTATKDISLLISSGFVVRKSPTKSSRTDYFELA